MQEAFAIVLFVVVGLAVVAAIIALATSRGSYDQIGGGRMSLDRQTTPAEREAEIRQMLEARNARRIRQGKEPLDVDAELSALTRPVADPALALEVRQLVEARNARRIRRGEEPLDVEDEVARRLRDLAQDD